MIFEAIEFATLAHKGQYRKGTRIPYIVHPLNAARTLIESDCGDPLVAAALLHDVVEDTRYTLNDVRERFGARVAELVDGASEPDRLASWERRKSHTIETLKTTPDPDLLLVAIADKLDNLRSVREDLALRGESTWSRFRRGRDKQEWYYRSLRDVFTERLRSSPGARLASLLAAEFDLVFDHHSHSANA
jgi:(p)ppGpp synthase/HD superfamily hydrolase